MSAHRPRVLVVVASKHGSTAEIGTALAGGLDDSVAGRAAGLFAVSMPVEQPPNGPGLGDELAAELVPVPTAHALPNQPRGLGAGLSRT